MTNPYEDLFKVYKNKFKHYENYSYSWIPKIPSALLKTLEEPKFHLEELPPSTAPQDYLAEKLTCNFSPFFKKEKWYKSRELWSSIIGGVIGAIFGAILTLVFTHWFP